MRFTNKFPYTNINNINLDWIIKRVKELGETVLGYAQDIANAVALAEAAQEAADSVTGTAESAVTTAQAAEATANAIAGTANTALATAQAAETTAQAAETTANAIAGTANTALATAQAAETTAQAAETTAQAAEETANNAETIAGTASANASNAVQTANTALATSNTALSIASQFDKSVLDEKAGSLITTETGAVVSFVPDRTIEQDLSVNVDIEPVQAGSGVPSPDNARPISGWDAVEIDSTGANLFGGLPFAQVFLDNQSSAVIDTTAKTIFHPYIPSTGTNFNLFSAFKPNTQYTIIIKGENSYQKPNLLIEYTNGSTTLLQDFSNSVSVTVSTAGKSISAIRTTSQGGSTTYYYDECGIFDGVLTADDFKPYTGTQYTITLGQTVYGGTLDVTNGTMTVDRVVEDAGAYSYSSFTYQGRVMFYAVISTMPLRTVVVSNKYAYSNQSALENMPDKSMWNYGWYIRPHNLVFYDTSFANMTSAEVQTALIGTQLCHYLTAPVVYQLTPQEVSTLLGQNNIWADAGNVKVEFAADLKWYIDSKIAELQALALENGG